MALRSLSETFSYLKSDISAFEDKYLKNIEETCSSNGFALLSDTIASSHCEDVEGLIFQQQGKVVLPPFSSYPPLMVDLMTGNHIDCALNQNFFKHLRNYNACLSFASFIATIDPPSNRGPPCFRISGQIMHRIGNLRHQQGNPPAYCQLYVYDPNTALNFRMEQNDCCIRELMELLQAIINQENPYALAFKNMAEVEDAEIIFCRL
nr:uncharacterized protein LOC105848423 [Hydra vulgaris]